MIKNNFDKHKVINGDCMDVLDDLVECYEGKIKLIVTDPPYNISHTKFGKVKVEMNEEEYIEWCTKWIEKCIKLLSEDGSIYIMGHARFTPYIMNILDKQGLYYTNQIIYHYTDGMHDNNAYATRYEPILYYRKNKDKFIFNLDDVRVEPIRHDKTSNKKGKNPSDVWADVNKEDIINEACITIVEEFEKNYGIAQGNKNDLIEFIEKHTKKYIEECIDFKRGDVWLINRVRHNSKERIKDDNGKKVHVSQKPEKLLERIIKASSNIGDIILDPFLGTGTTSAVAKKLGRLSIGIEKNIDYIDIINNRIESTEEEFSTDKVLSDYEIKGKFDPQQIHINNNEIENKYNKIDEWYIGRDRDAFYMTHDFHPYFAAFPPELVRRLINKYSNENDLILDCFMGGGSTVVETVLNNRVAYGIDISKLSKLLNKVKATPINIDEEVINRFKSEVERDILEQRMNSYTNFNYYIPKVVNIDKWFIERAKKELAIILHHINLIDNDDLKDFLKVAFSAIVRKCSNAKNAQQHLCTKKDKKIPDVLNIFNEKLDLMINQMINYNNMVNNVRINLFDKDCRKMSEVIDDETIDLIITSPPYGTGSRYTDINRLSFEWLDLEKPKGKNSLEKNKNFDEVLKEAIGQMYRVLKKGKYCCIVYGDPCDGKGLTEKAINDALDVGFQYIGLISCPIEKDKSKRHTKYRQYIPKDFILIFRKV